MKVQRFFSRAICTALAAALLAGCGGAQSGSMAPLEPVTNAVRADKMPWSNGALIYATGGCGGTCVLSYSDGSYVGSLPTGGASICSDQAGDVFIPANDTVTEYAHGSQSPTHTLSLPGNLAAGCAVDPTTNDLAVVFSGTATNIAIFANESGTPTLYQSGIESFYCGYDGSGNLFVNGLIQSGYGLSELVKGSSSFTTLAVNKSLGFPGRVQWDGKYVTWEGLDPSNVSISRLAISGSSVSVVGTTKLKNVKHRATQSWLYGSNVLVAYNIVGPRANVIGIWKYPNGGKPKRNIKRFGSFKKSTVDFQAVTVSLAP